MGFSSKKFCLLGGYELNLIIPRRKQRIMIYNYSIIISIIINKKMRKIFCRLGFNGKVEEEMIILIVDENERFVNQL